MSLDRYMRQVIISDDWDQEKLFNSKVAVIGSGTLATSVLMGLSMLGVGNIRIYDNALFSAFSPSEFFYFNSKPGTVKVEELERVLKESNTLYTTSAYYPDMSIPWRILDRSHLFVLGDKQNSPGQIPDVVIDASNNPFQQKAVIEWCAANEVPFINGASMAFKGEMKAIPSMKTTYSVHEWDLSPSYHNSPEDPVTSGIVAGIICEETRRILMPIKGEVLDEVSLFINFLEEGSDYFGTTPFVREKKAELIRDNYDITALVIGAGSLGTNVVRGLVQRGVRRIIVYDDDTVEELNLNRQYEYALVPSVGMPKVVALEKMVKKYDPSVKFIAKNEIFTPAYSGPTPDLVFRCTDSFESSVFINDYAVGKNIPVVYMATSFEDGEAFIAVPGQSSCIDCAFHVRENAEQFKVPEGCANAPNPSVGTINMAISYSGLALMDLYLNKTGQKLNVVIDYDKNASTRIASYPVINQCSHNGV